MLTLVLLALLAALTYWLDRAVQSPTLSREKLLVHEPDFLVDKLLSTRMDLNGRVRDSLQAARMVHYPDDDSTELELPRFMIYGQRAPLRVTARQGLVSSNGGNVYFRGDVRATRSASEYNSELVVMTDYLHLMPDDNIAKTDQPVTIRDATMTIDAGSMELNHETRVLKLSGGVKSVYHAAPAKRAGAAKVQR